MAATGASAARAATLSVPSTEVSSSASHNHALRPEPLHSIRPARQPAVFQVPRAGKRYSRWWRGIQCLPPTRCSSSSPSPAPSSSSSTPPIPSSTPSSSDSYNPMVAAVRARERAMQAAVDLAQNQRASSSASQTASQGSNAQPWERWEDDEDDGRMEHEWMREECGVVGVWGDAEAGRLCYLGLHAQQHRGQEGAGIVSCTDGGKMTSVTGQGLVADVFDASNLQTLVGDRAIGHVRYGTAGGSTLRNVQPFVASYRFGSMAVAHNGNFTNFKELREELEEGGSIFNTTSDSELILHLVALSREKPFIARLVDACQKLEGAFSLVVLTEHKLVAVRDPHGFRPLVMGRKDNSICFASETCALDLIGYKYEREVAPGEVVVVDAEGISSLCLMPQMPRKSCVFEHIYFSLPTSIVFSRSVYESRYRFGQILAETSPVPCDIVIAVPDSGIVSALGYADKAGVPFQQGLIRSHYVGRTFIEPSQKIRDFGVKLKLSPVKPVLEGKRVVVVDDSIVRGTTSKKIVRMLKDAGAAEVHMRITSPPITGSCFYGVDTPSRTELISWRLTQEETRDFVGADSLAFLPLDKLHEMLGDEAPQFCDACFSGMYPVLPPDVEKKPGYSAATSSKTAAAAPSPVSSQAPANDSVTVAPAA